MPSIAARTISKIILFSIPAILCLSSCKKKKKDQPEPAPPTIPVRDNGPDLPPGLNPDDLLLVRIESPNYQYFTKDTVEILYNTDYTVKEIRQMSPRFPGGYTTILTTEYENGRLMAYNTDNFPKSRAIYTRCEFTWENDKVALMRYYINGAPQRRDSLFYDVSGQLTDQIEYQESGTAVPNLYFTARTKLKWENGNVVRETQFSKHNAENGVSVEFNYTNRINIINQCVKDNLIWAVLNRLVSEYLSRNAVNNFSIFESNGKLKPTLFHRYHFDAAKMTLEYWGFEGFTNYDFGTYYFRKK